MSLYKRLHDAGQTDEPSRADSPVIEVRQRIHKQLIEELGPVLFKNDFDPNELELKVRDLLRAAIARERTPLSVDQKAEVLDAVANDILGYGPIDPLLADDTVTDIMANGPSSIYVERSGKLEKTDITFIDDVHLKRVIDKIVGQVGRRVDDASPLCDARLPDGSRVNAVVHPVAHHGPFLMVRKFSAEHLGIDDLIRLGTLNTETARFLQACILGRLNIVISGGSSSGKTTLLNVLSGFVPTNERILTVEDSKELQLHQDHVLPLEARPPNIEGTGEITIRDLVRNALRMRPDRIVVGECRGSEALDMLQAMNTGHDGSLTTLHANTAVDALSRVETLVLMSGYDLPMRAIREQMASALDLVVQMARLRDGTRRITEISEVQGMEGDVITVQDLFRFDRSMGVDAQGMFLGHLKPTGIRPKFSEKMADLGIQLPGELFAAEDEAEALPAPSRALMTGTDDGVPLADGPPRERVALFVGDAPDDETAPSGDRPPLFAGDPPAHETSRPADEPASDGPAPNPVALFLEDLAADDGASDDRPPTEGGS